MKKVLLWAGVGFVVLVVAITALGAIAGDPTPVAVESEKEVTPAATTPTTAATTAAATTAKPKPKKKAQPKVTAAQIEKSFIDGGGGRPIREMCDAAFTHWACFYDDVEVVTASTIRVNLTTDGGWSKSELKDLGKTAAQHWFNFLQFDHGKIDTIVVRVNGLDQNHYKRDFPGF